MKKLFVAIVLGLALTACTKPTKTTKILSDQGYTDIEITGYRFWACQKDDTFHTEFKAKSPVGKPVTGVVCSGWVMGGTIKFD